jgi:hypothetical protein
LQSLVLASKVAQEQAAAHIALGVKADESGIAVERNDIVRGIGPEHLLRKVWAGKRFVHQLSVLLSACAIASSVARTDDLADVTASLVELFYFGQKPDQFGMAHQIFFLYSTKLVNEWGNAVIEPILPPVEAPPAALRELCGLSARVGHPIQVQLD